MDLSYNHTSILFILTKPKTSKAVQNNKQDQHKNSAIMRGTYCSELIKSQNTVISNFISVVQCTCKIKVTKYALLETLDYMCLNKNYRTSTSITK